MQKYGFLFKIKHFFIFFMMIGMVHAQEGDSVNFPHDYFGWYKGDLNVSNSRGNQTYAMEFKLFPTDTIGQYGYTLIYGSGDTRQERSYTLKAIDAENGEYIVDENNGIILDDKVVGNKMYSMFEVGGALLVTLMTFESDYLLFEIVVSSTEDKNSSGGQNDSIPEVISYPVTTVQKAILYKQ